MSNHVYLIPYYFDENISDTFLLMGKKLLYSDVQGFFMNNPKQWVFSGGGSGEMVRSYKTSEDKKVLMRHYNQARKEFKEETGNDFNYDLDLSNPFNIVYFNIERSSSYYMFFIRIPSHKSSNFTKINRNKTDIYFNEIDFMDWIDIDIVYSLMTPKNNYNKYQLKMNDVKEYLDDLMERKEYWRLNDMKLEQKLRNFYDGKNKTYYINYSYRELLNDVYRYGSRIDDKKLNFMKMFFQSFIDGRSYVDWFHKGVRFFIETLNDMTTEKSILKYDPDYNIGDYIDLDIIDNFRHSEVMDDFERETRSKNIKISTSKREFFNILTERGDIRKPSFDSSSIKKVSGKYVPPHLRK